MKTASVTRDSRAKRPFVQRVARKWYAWAGLALGSAASYLAIDGQLRFDATNLLHASPAGNDVAWSAIPPAPELAPEPKEAVTTADPTPLTLPDEIRLPEPVPVPEVVTVPTERARQPHAPNLDAVLQSYMAEQVLLAASNDVQANAAPRIPVPKVPTDPLPLVPPMETAVEVVPEKAEPIPAPMANPPMPNLAPAPARNNLPIILPDQANPGEVVEPAPKPQIVQKGADLPPPMPSVAPAERPAPLGEQIPTRPTVDPSTNAALTAEAESLNSDQRLLYEAAQNNARMKDYPKAIEVYEQLLKLRPDLVYIRAEYAGILVNAGELQRAAEQYKRVLELKPDSMLYRIRLGDVYVIGKDYKAAIRVYSDALRNPPFEPEYAVRLARAYAFDNDFIRAFQVYDRMLANIKPDDPKAPAALGALLLDLDMPSEAIPYLVAKRKQLEKDPRRREVVLLEVLSNLVRGYARLGERQAAMDVIAELPTLATDQIGVRETLADQLTGIEEFELSAQVWNQILQMDPTYGPAIIGMARIYLEMSQPAVARQILDSFRPGPRQMRDYLFTYAVYHQRVGEYVEAKQIYQDMLRRNENDNDVRMALGLLYINYKDEWERAKAEFAKIPPQDPQGRAARRNFADALAVQRKYQEALEVFRLMLQEDPCDYLTIAAATRVYAKAGMFDQGITLARSFLSTNPRSEGQAVAVRLALGRALLEAGRYLEAIREYEILISRPSGRKIESYYGLMRAHEKLGNAERAKQFRACTAGLPGGEIRNQLELARFFALDYDDGRSIEICMALLNIDPRNLPVLIRMVDSQQRLSRFSGQPADVFQTAQTILGMSTTNIRGQFAMARSFAVAQNYRKASAQYDQLIQLDPDQYAPRIERARCLYADKQYSAARSSYDNILKPSPDEEMVVHINDMVARSPKLAAFLQPYVAAGVAGPGLRKELGRLEVSVPDAEIRLAVHRLVCDYDARLARQNAVKLEEEALEVKDYRQYTALGALQTASEFDQTNTETLFGLGQQFSALRYTQRAIDVYGQVLAVDPTHRDSMVASERASAEMGPKLDATASYFRQRGREGLASIDRTGWMVDGRIPLGDELEYLALGYRAAYYRSPFNYPETNGNIPFMRVQKRLTDLWSVYGQVNVEEYNNGFDTRPTFDVGTVYQFCEWASARFGGNLENVVENGESIAQDIHRGGIYLGADARPTRQWGFGGQYNYWHYSDDNDMNSFTLYNELALTLPPKMLKLAQRLYFWGYREGTIFPTNPPDEANIYGAVHPYFAPDGFSQLEMRVEWWHWLSRDYFVHSNQCYYSLQYGIMTDNKLVTYHNLRALLNYDVCTWLTVGAQADAQLSSPYSMFSALGYLQIRFR